MKYILLPPLIFLMCVVRALFVLAGLCVIAIFFIISFLWSFNVKKSYVNFLDFGGDCFWTCEWVSENRRVKYYYKTPKDFILNRYTKK